MTKNDTDITENTDTVKRRGIYLLPNFFTTAALFAGFYSIVAAMANNFDTAAIAIFIAMVMDGLDGRVARLTGTTSAFGAQYDSIADMVCFGIAPALVVHSWGLYTLGKIGWISSFIYTAGTALRLARFNIQHGKQDHRFFIGMPSPAAAAVIASMMWIATDFGIPGKMLSEIVAVITVLLGVLMVSNVKFHSFKYINLKGRVPFIVVLVMVLIFALIAWDPPKVLFIVSFSYAFSGPFMIVKRKYIVSKRKKTKK